MSAAENDDQKKLSPEESRSIQDCLGKVEPVAMRDAPAAAPEVQYIPRDKFEAAKKRVFAENRELLARLAK
jgi:hypothetical protein